MQKPLCPIEAYVVVYQKPVCFAVFPNDVIAVSDPSSPQASGVVNVKKQRASLLPLLQLLIQQILFLLLLPLLL